MVGPGENSRTKRGGEREKMAGSSTRSGKEDEGLVSDEFKVGLWQVVRKRDTFGGPRNKIENLGVQPWKGEEK